MDTKPSRWLVQQSLPAVVLRAAASPPIPQSTVPTPCVKVSLSLTLRLCPPASFQEDVWIEGSSMTVVYFQVPRSWPLCLPRSPTASLVGCPTNPQVSRHRSACPPHPLAPLPLMDWLALQGKCPPPPLARPHWGRPTPFRPRPLWPEHSPSRGLPPSPDRDPVCPLHSHLQPPQGSVAQPWPQFPSPWSRASWMDCLLGRACLQVNTTPWQQHPHHHRWGCSVPLSDLLWLCPMETEDECRTL